MAQTFSKPEFRHELGGELTANILPFWMTHVVDRNNGGFHGAVTNDLCVLNDVPRTAVLCARILWTFSAAYRKLGVEDYLFMARWAGDYLARVFWDQDHGGVFWSVDHRGSPVVPRKHHYAQAFAIYGLAEYHRATGDLQSLELAQALFHLLEEHGHDILHHGYIEGSSQAWEALDDMRLSNREINCRKTMNTMLHILEAYTNLLRVWDDAHLRTQHSALIETFQRHIIDHRTGHFKLFFDDRWHSLSENESYGHDIEGSWLLLEAAEIQGDPQLLGRVRESVIALVEAVCRDGLDDDGSVFYEGGPQGLVDTGKSWWVQAEAMVGFYNAFELTDRSHFAQAAFRCWQYIRAKMVDRTHGGWFKRLRRDGTPDETCFKAGPWEDPYHQSRACLELIRRLGG